jgi:F420-non-reducing hydrogenase iron-sulfur subunit
MDTAPELKIVAFCCKYCAYKAADLAGSMRLQMPPELRIVQVPCTGRLDMVEVLHAIEEGADGVMTLGCMPGDCHFLQGNLRARKRVEYVKRLLDDVGLEPERLEMFNLSSAMGGKFVEYATEMAERIRKLGPSRLRRSANSEPRGYREDHLEFGMRKLELENETAPPEESPVCHHNTVS